MYNLIFLRKENELNKILKVQRRTKHKMNVLFTSIWDHNSTALVDELIKKYPTSNSAAPPLYVVDSFKMPHSFVIYGTTKVPHLIRLTSDKIQSEDYLPVIKEVLGLRDVKWSLTK